MTQMQENIGQIVAVCGIPVVPQPSFVGDNAWMLLWQASYM